MRELWRPYKSGRNEIGKKRNGKKQIGKKRNGKNSFLQVFLTLAKVMAAHNALNRFFSFVALFLTQILAHKPVKSILNFGLR